MSWISNILNNQAYANWAVALTTIILVIVTLLFHFIGDSYTRLLKNTERHKFYNKAFDFLRASIANWGPDCHTTTGTGETVEEFINGFEKDLIENKIYLNIWDKIRCNKYIRLAKKLAHSFQDQQFDHALKIQKLILKQMKKLSKKIGREPEYKKLNDDLGLDV
ncbi:hypothetical protein SC828_05045 [Legionella pneumophila serogroup 1]